MRAESNLTQKLKQHIRGLVVLSDIVTLLAAFVMAESPVLVVLPTHTEPVYEQQILGQKSPLSSDLDEFRGIPFGVVPGRWQHSHVRDKLPEDVYSATSNGYVRIYTYSATTSDLVQTQMSTISRTEQFRQLAVHSRISCRRHRVRDRLPESFYHKTK